MRIRALLWKEFLDLGRNRMALLPVVIVTVLALGLPRLNRSDERLAAAVERLELEPTFPHAVLVTRPADDSHVIRATIVADRFVN